MIIKTLLLLSYGAKMETYKRGECIFFEGSTPKFYFQILEGTVRISTSFTDGKDFVHGYPFNGHCFGESYLFTEKRYAVSAFAERKCTILKLEKESLLKILKIEPELLFELFKYTADRLHFRYIVSSFLAINDPTIKIKTLFTYLKTYFKADDNQFFVVPYTRKQIAYLTGLRLETIIRVIKRMENSGVLKVVDKKIHF